MGVLAGIIVACEAHRQTESQPSTTAGFRARHGSSARVVRPIDPPLQLSHYALLSLSTNTTAKSPIMTLPVNRRASVVRRLQPCHADVLRGSNAYTASVVRSLCPPLLAPPPRAGAHGGEAQSRRDPDKFTVWGFNQRIIVSALKR